MRINASQTSAAAIRLSITHPGARNATVRLRTPETTVWTRPVFTQDQIFIGRISTVIIALRRRIQVKIR